MLPQEAARMHIQYSRFPAWALGQGINMNCVLHYFQMSEAVRPITRAFSPTFCHLSPILGPRGHVKIESDSQTSMLNSLIGLSCHGPDQSSLTPGLSEVFLLEPLDPREGCLLRYNADGERKIWRQRWRLTIKQPHWLCSSRQCVMSFKGFIHVIDKKDKVWDSCLKNLNAINNQNKNLKVHRGFFFLSDRIQFSSLVSVEWSPVVSLCGLLNQNVCFTCFAHGLMSTWCCHMKQVLLHPTHSLSIYV